MFTWLGWKNAPSSLRIFIPPDLRAGAIVRPDEFQAAQVYAFAQMYTQALNRWEKNGVQDFPARIEDLQSYMTQFYFDQLIVTMNEKMKRGELEGRTRYATIDSNYSQYRPENVTSLSDGTWNVSIVMQIVEKVANVEAKRIRVEFQINVVPINIDPQKNTFGLALNGTSPGYKERLLVD